MPFTINHFIKTAIIFGCSSCVFAQTFMGVEQSTSLKLQKYKTPAPAVQPMSAQDFKGTVGSLSEQTQNAVSQGINKKLLPPPAPMPNTPTTTEKPLGTPDTSSSTSVTNNPTLPTTQVAPTQQQPAPTITNPSVNNMPAPTSNSMAPANPTPSSTPVYSGFQGTGNTTNTNTTTPPPRRGSNNNNTNAPAKSSGWNINY